MILWDIVFVFSKFPGVNANLKQGVVVVVIVWKLDLQLHVQSVHIATNVESSNPTQGELYLIQHYVIKFVTDLREVGGFLRVLQFPPPIHDIPEILLKVALSTITPTNEGTNLNN